MKVNSILSSIKVLFSIFAFIFLFSSCEKREQPIKFRVNQFKQTAVAVGPIMTLSIQQGDQIGTENWAPLYSQIVGFDYEPGYIYDLLVTTTEIKNPPADGSSQAYHLKQVLSKTKVNANTQFDLNLKIDQTVFVKGNVNTGFTILNQIEIDCGNICQDFATVINSGAKHVSGKFILNEDGSIRLIELARD